MDSVLIAYLAFVAGAILGFIVVGETLLHKKRMKKNATIKKNTIKLPMSIKDTTTHSSSNKDVEFEDSDDIDVFENSQKECGTISLADKISDKSLTFTDFNCVADEIDSDAYIKKIRAREDSAYNALKDKIQKKKDSQCESKSEDCGESENVDAEAE